MCSCVIFSFTLHTLHIKLCHPHMNSLWLDVWNRPQLSAKPMQHWPSTEFLKVREIQTWGEVKKRERKERPVDKMQRNSLHLGRPTFLVFILNVDSNPFEFKEAYVQTNCCSPASMSYSRAWRSFLRVRNSIPLKLKGFLDHLSYILKNQAGDSYCTCNGLI